LPGAAATPAEDAPRTTETPAPSKEEIDSCARARSLALPLQQAAPTNGGSMNRAHNTLRSIVKAKEMKEDQLLAEVASLGAAVREARRRVDDGLFAIEIHERGTAATSQQRSAWLGLAREYRRRLDREVYEARAVLDESERAAEAMRQKAVSAGQERRAAEQLAERRIATENEAKVRIDRARMDELGLRARGLL